MTRGILVVGNESPTCSALIAEVHSRVDSAAVAVFPNRFGARAAAEAPAPLPPKAALLPWNPASPVAARALVVGAENRLGRIDQAILACSPPAVRRRADELAPADVDAAVDDLVKGWFFLVRELAAAFRARGSGTLALVLSEAGLDGGKEDAADLVGSVAAAAFRSLAQGLLSSSFREPYRVLAFSSSEAGEDAAFASFALRILDEDSKRDGGKWHKFSKGGIFGMR